MSGTAITKEFEQRFAEYFGTRFALGFCNGTASLTAAMWACGIGTGDEIICPSMTYWASAAPAKALGASVHFCDIDPMTLCLDPNDLEHRISERTKAVVVVHYAGHPAPMDKIMSIAQRHQVHVIEDNSHAHGSLYHGKYTGTIGDIGAMSLMAGKGFAIGEAGIITTNNRELYERCIAFAHYERTGVPSRFNPVDNQITDPDLHRFAGIPIGAMKGRMNQTCSAMGLIQLRYFSGRIQEIQEALNYFWERLAGTPGLRPHKIPLSEGTMGCWYYPQCLYHADELNGISSKTFAQAINAEGIHWCFPGGNSPLHFHPYFYESDVLNLSRPTSVVSQNYDFHKNHDSLKVSENIHEISIAIPWFKKNYKKDIQAYADAFIKVANYFHDNN